MPATIVWQRINLSKNDEIPKPDLHNINAHTKFGENPLIFTQDIILKGEYGRVAGTIKNGRILPISNSKPDLHKIKAYTKFSENPLTFIQVIVQKRKYRREAEQITVEIGEICPLAIPNQVSTISMNIPSWNLLIWYLLVIVWKMDDQPKTITSCHYYVEVAAVERWLFMEVSLYEPLPNRNQPYMLPAQTKISMCFHAIWSSLNQCRLTKLHGCPYVFRHMWTVKAQISLRIHCLIKAFTVHLQNHLILQHVRTESKGLDDTVHIFKMHFVHVQRHFLAWHSPYIVRSFSV